MEKKCEFCGIGFETRSRIPGHEKYCSTRCNWRAKDRRANPRIGLVGYQIEKQCAVCGGRFLTRSKSPGREVYCGKKCRTKAHNAAHQERIRKEIKSRICTTCGNEFMPGKWRPEQLTCSKKCSQQRQNKISRNGADIPASRECARCKIVFRPKKIGQIYCSGICSRRQANRRRYESLGYWPGNRKRTYFRQNRLAALQRDKVCRVCNSEGPLLVHHLDGSGETESPNHQLDNLMSVCPPCHKQIHTINYRIIDNKLYVLGKIFEVMGVSEVAVLPVS